MDHDALIAQLDRHEDDRLEPYDDATGKTLRPGDVVRGNITIARGINLSAGISPHVSDLLTDDAIGLVEDDLDSSFEWWASLSERRQLAIADLRFNVGASGFRLFRKLIHALAIGDWPGAAAEIRNSQIAPGRKADLAQMMEQG